MTIFFICFCVKYVLQKQTIIHKHFKGRHKRKIKTQCKQIIVKLWEEKSLNGLISFRYNDLESYAMVASQTNLNVSKQISVRVFTYSMVKKNSKTFKDIGCIFTSSVLLSKSLSRGKQIKFFISGKVSSMPIYMGLDFFCVAKKGTLAEVEKLNPIFGGFQA